MNSSLTSPLDYQIQKWALRSINPLEQMGEVKINGQARGAAELEGENRQLRKELECVKRQREILKKAMSVLGEEPSGGMR